MNERESITIDVTILPKPTLLKSIGDILVISANGKKNISVLSVRKV